MRVVINGAGIAGTALAYWLNKLGHEVLLVEQASELRAGGYVLNLWGIGFGAAEKMGAIPRLQELRYQVDGLRMVNRRGRTRGGYPARVFLHLTHGRFMALGRADIATAIYSLLNGRVETIFGDSVAAIEDDGSRVRVSFDHSPRCDADLVIGADGLHSRVRQIVFGPEAHFEYPMGCHVAEFEADGYRPRDEHLTVMHGAPGRYISKLPLHGDRTLFFLVFRDDRLADAVPASASARKTVLTRVFSDVGWECPRILSAMEGTEDIYFDSVSQIRMDGWAKGRTVLIGDAAACPSLIAGEGAGLALAEAYVLAGELHHNTDSLDTALARYEERMKPYVTRKQKQAERLVPSFVPRTAFGVNIRDFATLFVRFPVFRELLMGRYLHDDIALPDYSI